MTPSITTFTGKRIDPFDPDPEQIVMRDIAHALAHQCRFGGHAKRFYSIAEHSWLVADMVHPRLKLAALLHDASEAYLCDVPSPIKRSPAFSFYREAEAALQDAIYEKFDCALSPIDKAAIQRADQQMLGIEAQHVLSSEPDESLIWYVGLAKRAGVLFGIETRIHKGECLFLWRDYSTESKAGRLVTCHLGEQIWVAAELLREVAALRSAAERQAA